MAKDSRKSERIIWLVLLIILAISLILPYTIGSFYQK